MLRAQAETPHRGRHGNPSAPWEIAATIQIEAF
nr:MAG TPA: hypothetical protein [Caudoviricetes sp.]